MKKRRKSENRKVVLQDMDGFFPAGIERFVFNIYNNKARGDISFDFVLAKYTESFYSRQIEAKGENAYYLGVSGTLYSRIRSYIRFFLLVREKKYSVVHIQGFTFNNSIHSFLARLAGVKHIIMHSHNDMDRLIDNKHKLFFFIARIIMLKSATDYWCCSEVAGRWAFGDKYYNSNKVKIIENGLYYRDYLFDITQRKEKRRILNYQEDNFVIGHIGRFHKQKNHIFIIEMFEKIYKKNNKVRLLLVGEGELKEKIKGIVNEKKLNNVVYFHDATNNVRELYSAMDLFFLPSNDEGLGIVAVEAQLSGLPVVCSNAVPKEVAISNNIDFLDFKDENLWIEYILKRVGQNRKKIKSLAAFWEKGYDINSVAEKVFHMYSQMMENEYENNY